MIKHPRFHRNFDCIHVYKYTIELFCRVWLCNWRRWCAVGARYAEPLLGSIFSRKLPRNRYAFAMRKLDMIHMRSPCESICIVGKNKEDGAFRCHLLFGLLIRFTEWGYWRTDFEGKSPADERRCSYLLRARKRRFSPKYQSQTWQRDFEGKPLADKRSRIKTYGECGNEGFHQNVKAKLGEEILRENFRLTSDGVVTYSERGNDDFYQNMKAKITIPRERWAYHPTRR